MTYRTRLGAAALAPATRAARAPAALSRATHVGAKAASRSGSSPTSAAW